MALKQGVFFMFYSKKDEKELTDKLFENPTSEYRGAPFWAWKTQRSKRTK